MLILYHISSWFAVLYLCGISFIQIVLPADTYIKNNLLDDYHRSADLAIQHVTTDVLEDAEKANSMKAVSLALILGAVIKYDLQKRRISLFDCTQLVFNGDIHFAAEFDSNNDDDDETFSKVFVAMTLHADGSIDIGFTPTENTHRLFDSYNNVPRKEQKNVDAYVAFGAGPVFLIEHTELYMMPDTAAIEKAFSVKKTKFLSRSTESRDLLLGCAVDISVFDLDGHTCYAAGDIGSGMKVKIINAPNIRRIIAADGSDQRLTLEETHDLAMLLNVVFVRPLQLTVLPFPVKYLREYAIEHSELVNRTTFE